MRYKDLPDRWKLKVKEYLKSIGKDNQERLSSIDFPTNKKVIINFEDESFVEFRYAFIIKLEELNEIGLFTEHCGYHIFNS